jgi:hypothetical protein
VGKPEEKRPLGTLKRRCEDDIKIDLRKVRWSDMDWIHLVQNSGQ